MDEVVEIELEKLFVGECNVRKEKGDLTELSNSIKEKGILEPLVVRPIGEKYEVIVGSRRLEAAKIAGLQKVPVIIKQMDDKEAMVTSLIENIQRENLQPEEEAAAYQKLIKILGSIRKVAKSIGKSEASIREVLEANELVLKLRELGLNVRARRAPSKAERESLQVIPLRDARMIVEALKSKKVAALPEEEKNKKIVELFKTIVPLPEHKAMEIIKKFKRNPDKSIDAIKQEVLSMEKGFSMLIYFDPKLASAISKAAEEKNIEQKKLVIEILKNWLKESNYL
ncbi:MAG: ParB/RepB/Spo0J family partition protein [Candidatus Parvarchaeota archaeon]|nr:ParB/RepB/Spo0J family partition protein [Candidatus Jingweiarchaeum tengchongense]MCW1297998.1 ParB/RepB/Spo0J family partition protein [Candidatus Jingweiarchaeum tengchongense]MCW1300061.1 ParB/RepB/Spo0J family partition protein [Candidatus Jingweiarchaeum tengchongense]MCW1304412.1 ParB/RepB/Spo0J family partition protein [Candidatus Jingweiarchaeum tengchongense]MCW1305962.1 ParB/RepB/Spo0J family partition protein [Candidatus Jingweiarchaeum tengchongense]